MGILKRLAFVLTTGLLYIPFTVWLTVAGLIAIVAWIVLNGQTEGLFDSLVMSPFEWWTEIGENL